MRGTSGDPVRAAVVGAGVMGRWHVRELQRAGGRLVGVADKDASAARALGGPASYDDVDRLLAETSPEVVHVCTPTQSHVEIGERVLGAGAHLLVEKPAGATVAETERLIALAEARGLLVCPVHQYVFQPPLRDAEGLLAPLAPILHVSSTSCSAGGFGGELDEVAADILPHPLGVIHRLVPGGVDGLVWNAARPRSGELRATALAPSASVSICISMGGRPTCNELVVICGGGTLHVDFFHGYGVVESGGVSRVRKVLRPFALGALLTAGAAANLSRRALQREPAYPGLRRLIRELYAFVLGATAPPIAHEESLAVAHARQHLLEAASGDG